MRAHWGRLKASAAGQTRAPCREKQKRARDEDLTDRCVRRVGRKWRPRKDQLPEILTRPHREPRRTDRFERCGAHRARIGWTEQVYYARTLEQKDYTPNRECIA